MPSREALRATYNGGEDSAEIQRLKALAAEYRAVKDWAAAGMIEKDLAAEYRMAHTRRAEAWDTAQRTQVAEPS
jgi:hypothetical protein